MAVQGSLYVRLAQDRDVNEIVSLLTEGAERQRGFEGTAGWPIPYPLDQVAIGVRQGIFYVAEIDGRIVATFALHWDDPRFWGSQPPIAGYVHKLAVRKAMAHQEIGRRTIEWIAHHVRASGRTVLRLDCLSTNRRLVAFYESLGFRGVRIVRAGAPGEEWPWLLMERPLL